LRILVRAAINNAEADLQVADEDVGNPEMFGRHPDPVNSAEQRRVPLQVLVDPTLRVRRTSSVSQ